MKITSVIQMDGSMEGHSIQVALHNLRKQRILSDCEQEMRSRNQVHRFYFVKFQPSPEELKIEEAEKMYREMTIARFHVIAKIEEQKVSQCRMEWELELSHGTGGYIARKRLEIESLEQALDDCCCSRKPRPRTATILHVPQSELHKPIVSQVFVQLSRNRHQNRLHKEQIEMQYLRQAQDEILSPKTNEMMFSGTNLPSEELNDILKGLKYRIQHGTKNQAQERKLLQEMKHAKATQEICCQYQSAGEVTGSKQSIQNEINILLNEIEEVKKVHRGSNTGTSRRKKLEALEKYTSSLEKKLEDVLIKREKAKRRALELREQIKEQKSYYNEYGLLMSNAKEVARKKDVKGLKELSEKQVEKFMSNWNSSKSF